MTATTVELHELAEALNVDAHVAAVELALAALLVRYLQRKPGRCVLTLDELSEAGRLLARGVVKADDVDGGVAVTFDHWPQP